MTAGANREFSKEIRLPVDMAVSVNDLRDVMKELKTDLRDIERDSRRAIREGGDVDRALESRRSATEAKIQQVKDLQHIHDRQQMAQAELHRVYGSMAGQLSRMPVWAIAGQPAATAMQYAAQAEYYGNALAKSALLSDAAKGTGLASSAARMAQRAGVAAAGIGTSVSGALTGSVAATAAVPAVAAAGVALYGAYYGAKTESMVNEGRMRDVLANIAISATRDAVSGGDRVSLATMQRHKTVTEAAANKMYEIQYQASGWNRIRDAIGLGASTEVTNQMIRQSEHSDKMFNLRSVYGEAFYQKLVDPSTFRARIERRIDREAYGSEGYLRAATWWAKAGWSGLFGSYDGFIRDQQATMLTEWQDKTIKSQETLRATEQTQFRENPGRALDRVLANERARRDAAISAEQYSRWNDWATI
jgi:hypothetical protein